MYIHNVNQQSNALTSQSQRSITQTFGDFNGNSYQDVDKETGFLEIADISKEMAKQRYANGFGPLSIFNTQKKLLFLNNLYDVWPNMSKACALTGISRWTLNNHLSIDQSLRECVEDIRSMVVDHIHGVRMKVAAKDSGSFDRMCVLNAHMPELYNPKTKIEIEHTMSSEQAIKRDRVIESVIDAEVVDTVRRVRKLKADHGK